MEWKPMFGYEKYYEVNLNGEIRSLRGNFAGKINKGYINKKGYVRLTIRNEETGKNENVSAHRMIAKTFIPNPHNKPHVNHKNGIKTDNRVENLEWCTQQENELHSYQVLGKKPNKTALGKFGYLNKKAIAINVFDHKTGNFLFSHIGVNDLARKLNCKPSGISHNLKNKRHSHNGYVFKYADINL